MENLKIDENGRNVLGAITNDILEEIKNLRVNPATGRLLVDAHLTSTNTEIGDTIPGGTAGSVLFLGLGATLAQDNANFFYDDTNNFLGLGTDTPAATLDIEGTFIYNDGTPTANYLMTCVDNLGNATWTDISTNAVIMQSIATSNFFVTALVNNNNFITTLTSNALFISNLITNINITGLVSVVTDGVTITGDGTVGNPLVAVAGGGAVQTVSDDGGGVVTVDNTDPVNPIVGFGGVNVSTGISGSGTAGNPLTNTGVITVSGLNTDNSDPANPVVNISVDGVTITGAGTVGSPLVVIGGSGGGTYFIDQTPATAGMKYGTLAGAVNGMNTQFTVSQTEYLTGKLAVFLNGEEQINGNADDWQETVPANGTFDFVVAPQAGDVIQVIYQTATGNGVMTVTDDGNGQVSVDNTDPQNPIIDFTGVVSDGITITGTGLAGSPLMAVGGSGGTKVGIDGPSASYSGGTTTLHTIPIPGGILGTNNAIKFKTRVQFNGNGWGSDFKFYYGGTLIGTLFRDGGSGASYGTFEGTIIANGATNSQFTSIIFIEGGIRGFGSADPWNNFLPELSSAVDSTLAQDLVMTVVAQAGASGNTSGIIVEKII